MPGCCSSRSSASSASVPTGDHRSRGAADSDLRTQQLIALRATRAGIQIPKNQKPQLLKSGSDRRHPAAVVVERLVIAPALTDATPGLIGRRWPPARIVGRRRRPTGPTRPAPVARRASLVLSAGWGAARALAIPELAGCVARLGARNPGTGGQQRRAGQRDRGTAGQMLEIHDQPPLAVGQSRMDNRDCRRLFSEAMREFGGVRTAPARRRYLSTDRSTWVSRPSRHARHAVTSQNFLKFGRGDQGGHRRRQPTRSGDRRTVGRKPLICRQFQIDQRIERSVCAVQGVLAAVTPGPYTLGF